MGFVGIYRAIYDYSPQSGEELAIKEGDLLFILEKSPEDAWWKAKKKASDEDDDEPEGLIPNNYVEEAQPLNQAKTLYEYSRQTDEELSFKEDSVLQVYDTTDPGWTLVGFDNEYGFVPANYIETTEAAPPSMPARPRAPSAQVEQQQPPSPASMTSPKSPAAALAGIIQQKTGPSSPSQNRTISQNLPPRPQYTPDASDEDEPAPQLPRRPQSDQYSPSPAHAPSPRSPEPPGVMASPAYGHSRSATQDYEDGQPSMAASGFRLYSIHEMVSHLGKSRKMPTTLGINLSRGAIMIAPEKSRDGPTKEWTANQLTHYSIEGKHVFMELVRPSKSIDFHAGTKDTAEEIVSLLGEVAGLSRAEGLREILAAGAGSSKERRGVMLYEFMAQDDDEVTVAVGDDVIVLDDSKNEEWWLVRRVKNGKEGVVPSSYVELSAKSPPSTSYSGANGGKSIVEQNRLEEERQTRDAAKSKRKDSKASEVGPGLPLPNRQSSLSQGDSGKKRSHKKKDSRGDKQASSSKSKPDESRVRTWTDRTGSFKVEAEFMGLKDAKIHLHKLNGVKIAVPVSKMSVADLDYVEAATGQSLDEDKPLSDVKRKNTQRQKNKSADDAAGPVAGASVEQQPPKYDWFDFFLACGVNPQICERYTSAFTRDQMGEENLQDIDPSLLRTLGLKEGDILRVMKHLDSKFGRTREKSATGADADGVNGANGGLFSGPGGALRNNTRKGRPAPAVQTNDTVDSKAFEPPAESRATPLTLAPKPGPTSSSGFDDDAWDVKPSKQLQTPSVSEPLAAKPATGALAELSLLSPPLQPSPAPQRPQAPAQQQPQVQQQQQQQTSQPTGADPSFFNQLAQGTPGAQQSQPTGLNQTQSQFTGQRQRPQPPLPMQNQGSLMPPLPPSRPLSAPQNMNPNNSFGPPPLQQQLTGYQGPQPSRLAPNGQSMSELNQQRFQQMYQQQLQPQQTGFGQPLYNQYPNGIPSQQTGYPHFTQLQQPPQGFSQFPAQIQQQFINGQQAGSPFADPPRQPFQSQPTGFQQSFSPPPQLQQQQTGINSFLPQALQPQQTAIQPQRTAINTTFGNPPPTLQQPLQTGGMNGFGQPAQTLPPMQQQQPQPQPQPLVPQKTGPAPPVRFGVQNPAAKPLVPQPTGRANLSKATPQNPFGF